MADATFVLPQLVAAAGAGLVAFALAAMAAVAEARTPSLVALVVGSAALAVDAALGSSAPGEGAAALRVLALSDAAGALIAPAFLFHLRVVLGADAPRRLPRWDGLLPLVAAAVALAALLCDGAALDGLSRGEDVSAAATAVAAMVALVTLAVPAVQGAALMSARRLIRTLAPDDPRRRWARRLLRVLAGLYLVAVTAQLASFAGLADEAVARLAEIPAVVALYGIALAALVDRDLFARAAARLAPRKYARSALDEDRVDELVRRARRALERDRLFADPALSLDRLAAAAGVRPNDLSQALNRAGTGYADLVSARRIEEACRLLADPGEEARTVLDVALAVGFNAKSTFNAAFLRHVGTTPGAYRTSRLTAARQPSA